MTQAVPVVKLRESNPFGKVNVLVNKKKVASFPEYRQAAEYLMTTYKINDGQMRGIYRDYKDDYDKRR